MDWIGFIIKNILSKIIIKQIIVSINKTRWKIITKIILKWILFINLLKKYNNQIILIIKRKINIFIKIIPKILIKQHLMINSMIKQ